MNEPGRVSLLSKSPSKMASEMTARRLSWPDMSTHMLLTQSARLVRFFDLIVGLGDFVSGVCGEGKRLGYCCVTGV